MQLQAAPTIAKNSGSQFDFSINEKRQAETLTAEEHTELLGLIDQIEAHDVERVKNLGKLAQLRHKMNRQNLLNLRRALYVLGEHPPGYR